MESNQKHISYTNVKNLFLTPSYVLLIGGTSAIGLVNFLPYVLLPELIIHKGFDDYQAATVIMVSGLTGIIGRNVVGALSYSKSITNRPIMCGVLFIVGGITTTVCDHMDQIYMFAIYSGLVGIFSGSIAVIKYVILHDIVGRDDVSLGTGIILFFNGICVTIGIPIGGIISDLTGGYRETFYYAGIAFIIGGVIFMTIPIFTEEPDDDVDIKDRHSNRLYLKRFSTQPLVDILPKRRDSTYEFDNPVAVGVTRKDSSVELFRIT